MSLAKYLVASVLFAVASAGNSDDGFQAAPSKAADANESLSTGQIVGYVFADLLLLCGAALFAGLTLSVMGLDTLSLEIIASSGQEPDKSYAARILPIRRKGNQLLCTLILGNVMVNTLIAQITDRFVSGWVGVALSTALITVGGEILPQATMAAHALQVGAGSAPIVKFFLTAFYPICKPLSMFLDRAIGNDPGQVYERNELKKLFALHAGEHGAVSGLAASDVNLLFGAMDLGSVTVADVMTPMQDVFMIESSERLDSNQLQRIWQSGHSRIPVYKTTRSNIVGVLYAKDLLMVSPAQNARIHDFVKFHRRHIIAVNAEKTLMAMLKEFQTGSSHIALVRRVAYRTNADPIYEAAGIITLDDVIGRLIGDEIQDDMDAGADGEEDGDARAAGSPALPFSSGAATQPQQPHHHHHHGQIVTAAAAALYGSMAARHDRTLGPVTGAALRLVRSASTTANHRRAIVYFLRESVAPLSGIDSDDLMDLVASRALVYEVIPPSNARGLKLSSRNNVWLYKTGHTSNMFTLIIQGSVQVVLPASRGNWARAADAPFGTAGEPLFMDLPTWSVLGAPILNAAAAAAAVGGSDGKRRAHAAPYEPDFSARVVSNATVLQLHFADLREFFAGRAANPT
jgi:metal transporter CNNM